MEPAKILILYTGGTFGMAQTPAGLAPDPDILNRIGRVAAAFAHACDLATTGIAIDSANLTPADWYRIAAAVADRYEDYAGFVVIHGTDTMAYCASGVSFALQGLAKPVVFTGAQIPLGLPRSDAVRNLETAVSIAASGQVREVCICFGARILRGNRARKVSASAYQAFASPNYPALGTAGIGIAIDDRMLLQPALVPSFRTQVSATADVAVVQIHPGLTGGQLTRLLEPPTRGIILSTYGTGNAPSGRADLLQALADAAASGTAIVAVSQCLAGSVELGCYAAGRALADTGVVSGRDMTIEAAFAKLTHLLSLGLDGEDIRKAAGVSLAGEVSPA